MWIRAIVASLIAALLTAALWQAVDPAWRAPHFINGAKADILLSGCCGPAKGAAAAAYSGPGDVVAGSTGAYSCARAYNAAYANGTNSLCDLVAVTGGAAVCTLRVLTTGFVDLAASYCAGTTPSAACAAATGGACKVSKAYDMSGAAHDMTSPGALLASMPTLTFGVLNGLPCMTFPGAQNLAGGGAGHAQPDTFSFVAERTGNTSADNGIGGDNGTQAAYYGTAANTAHLFGGSASATVAAADNAFHALQAVFNGASSNIYVDGTPNTVNAGVNSMSAGSLVGQDSGGSFLTGKVCEMLIYPSGFSLTAGGDADKMNTNQHSAANGYNF